MSTSYLFSDISSTSQPETIQIQNSGFLAWDQFFHLMERKYSYPTKLKLVIASVRRRKSEKGQSDRSGTEIVNSGSLVAKRVRSGLESLLELWFHHLKIVISLSVPWAIKDTYHNCHTKERFLYKVLLTELAYSKHPVNLSYDWASVVSTVALDSSKGRGCSDQQKAREKLRIYRLHLVSSVF